MSLFKAKKSKVDRPPITIDLFWEFKSRLDNNKFTIVQTRLGDKLAKINIWLFTLTENVASNDQ